MLSLSGNSHWKEATAKKRISLMKQSNSTESTFCSKITRSMVNLAPFSQNSDRKIGPADLLLVYLTVFINHCLRVVEKE